MRKTHKSVAKRFKITASGKLKHSKTCRSHLLTNKGRATHRDRFGKILDVVEMPRMNKLLPHKG